MLQNFQFSVFHIENWILSTRIVQILKKIFIVSPLPCTMDTVEGFLNMNFSGQTHFHEKIFFFQMYILFLIFFLYFATLSIWLLHFEVSRDFWQPLRYREIELCTRFRKDSINSAICRLVWEMPQPPSKDLR